MKILIGTGNFQYLTGAELYYYELARELVKRGNKVVVVSPQVGGLIKEKVEEAGIVVSNIMTPPEDFTPDIMHLSHTPITKFLTAKYPTIPAVSTIHSEVYQVENPYIHHNIKKYICIRGSILDKITTVNYVPREKAVFIPNGIDLTRFNKDGVSSEVDGKFRVLYVGIMNQLREQSVGHFIKLCKENHWTPQFIGINDCTYVDKESGAECIFTDPKIGGVWDIEKYIKQCDMTAGILLGRTTVEGWLCGKLGLIYDINMVGEIESFAIHKPPIDVEQKYDIKNVCTQIQEVYNEALRSA